MRFVYFSTSFLIGLSATYMAVAQEPVNETRMGYAPKHYQRYDRTPPRMRPQMATQAPVAATPVIKPATVNNVSPYGYKATITSQQVPNGSTQQPDQPDKKVETLTSPAYAKPKVNIAAPSNYTPAAVVIPPAPPITLQPAAMPPAQLRSAPPAVPTAPVATPQRQGWQEFVPAHMREVRSKSALRTSVYTGYRVDNLDWNIAGNIAGNSPTILSELTWENLEMVEVGGTAGYTHPDGTLKQAHVEVAGSYGTIIDGENQDSDYLADGRQAEFSRSNNKAEDGDSVSLKAAVGYEADVGSIFHPNDPSIHSWVTPMVGYAYQTLDVEMTDGFQTIPALGPFAGLNSTYDTEWTGPFFAVKGGTHVGNHRLELRGEYHYADYEGTAQWNLRTDFAQPVSFIHTGDANGFQFGLDYGYDLASNLSLFANAAYSLWTVEDGYDVTILSDGSSLSTRLNEVNWDSQAYRLGLAYSF